MALYVDAGYTVDDADYFIFDSGDPLYVECDYWSTIPDYYADGDGLCVVSVSSAFVDWRRRRRMRRLNIRNA